MHLISALQLAGFRHVLGTLWEVGDRQSVHCPGVDVATAFYIHMCMETMSWGDESVALALHLALRAGRAGMNHGEQKQRDSKVKSEKRQDNYQWVPFVHFGV